MSENPQTPKKTISGNKHALSSPEVSLATTVSCDGTPCLKCMNDDGSLKYKVDHTPRKLHLEFLKNCMEEAVGSKKDFTLREKPIPNMDLELSGSEENLFEDVLPYYIRLKTVGKENTRPKLEGIDWSRNVYCPLCDFGNTWEEKCPWDMWKDNYWKWVASFIGERYKDFESMSIDEQNEHYKEIRYHSYRQLSRMVNGGPIGKNMRIPLEVCLELRVKYWWSYGKVKYMRYKSLSDAEEDIL